MDVIEHGHFDLLVSDLGAYVFLVNFEQAVNVVLHLENHIRVYHILKVVLTLCLINNFSVNFLPSYRVRVLFSMDVNLLNLQLFLRQVTYHFPGVVSIEILLINHVTFWVFALHSFEKRLLHDTIEICQVK